ncbi:TPA: TorF family putative porin [Pseudomonas aeruginosa]
MLKHLLVLTCALLASSSALAQVMARDLGDFELKLATSPTRSMAQGLIRYSRPEQPANDAAELYGGLSIFGSRLGAALSSDPGRNDTTLFADLGVNPPFGFDVTLKYGNHRLDNPASLSGGGYVSVFNDWSVNLSRPWLGIDLNLSYSGTSLTGSDCSAYSGHNSYCDTTFMLKASRPFF